MNKNDFAKLAAEYIREAVFNNGKIVPDAKALYDYKRVQSDEDLQQAFDEGWQFICIAASLPPQYVLRKLKEEVAQ